MTTTTETSTKPRMGEPIGPYRGQMMKRGDIVLAAGSLGLPRLLLDVQENEALVYILPIQLNKEKNNEINSFEKITNTLFTLVSYPRIDETLDIEWVNCQQKFLRYGDGKQQSIVDSLTERYMK